eukprot:COSAG04_NODE_1900_length_5274_cov_60.599807_5_plen_76_part_00
MECELRVSGDANLSNLRRALAQTPALAVQWPGRHARYAAIEATEVGMLHLLQEFRKAGRGARPRRQQAVTFDRIV